MTLHFTKLYVRESGTEAVIVARLEKTVKEDNSESGLFIKSSILDQLLKHLTT